jgi:hypothetical protein
MKKYLIAFTVMLVILGMSFIFKTYISGNVFVNFPKVGLKDTKNEDNTFYLFLFFSMHNCKSCLDIIDVLKILPAPFKIYGVVPGEEIKNRADLIAMTGFEFELLDIRDFYRYQPAYSPTLIGVMRGRIYFVIPVTTELKDHFYDLVMSYYYSLYR